MRSYLVTIGPRTAPRLQFPAMAPDSCTCVAQHAGLVQPGERIAVQAHPEAVGCDRAALLAQVAANRRDPHCAGLY